MEEILTYAPEKSQNETERSERLSNTPSAKEYADKQSAEKARLLPYKMSELDQQTMEIKGIIGEYFSENDVKVLLEWVQKEKQILLASVVGNPETIDMDPELTEEIREIGMEIFEIIKDAIIPEWYEIPLYALPIAWEAAGANRMRKVTEAIAKVSKTLERLKASGGMKEKWAQVIEDALKDLIVKGETWKLEHVIRVLQKQDAPRKEFAKELSKIKELAENTKKAKITETPKPPSVTKEVVETTEELKWISHKGRIDKLTEIFSHWNPSKEKFADTAKERLLEAERHLDNAVEKWRIKEELRGNRTRNFLDELHKAAESHIWDGKVPEFKNVQETLKYLESLKSTK